MVGNPNNQDIYRLLLQIADLLELQGASTFRINAFRHAAEEITMISCDLKRLALEKDLKELIALPGIGPRIASIIADYAGTGGSRYLNRLKGDISLEQFIERIPGIGPSLARRIMNNLSIGSLEELELAAYDGRLDQIQGFGKARVHLTKIALGDMLKRRGTAAVWQNKFAEIDVGEKPSAGLLLELDAQYNRLVKENKLRKIAPKRFNPAKKTWLPIFHTDRINWHFTILYSNTARAHQLNKHKDWVIIYYHENGNEGQATVVTETKGNMKGKRVVRGREDECKKYYNFSQLVES